MESQSDYHVKTYGSLLTTTPFDNGIRYITVAPETPLYHRTTTHHKHTTQHGSSHYPVHISEQLVRASRPLICRNTAIRQISTQILSLAKEVSFCARFTNTLSSSMGLELPIYSLLKRGTSAICEVFTRLVNVIGQQTTNLMCFSPTLEQTSNLLVDAQGYCRSILSLLIRAFVL